MSNSPPNQIHAKTSLINEILLASMFSTSYVQVTPKNTPIASIPIIIVLSETVGMFSILVLSDSERKQKIKKITKLGMKCVLVVDLV